MIITRYNLAKKTCDLQDTSCNTNEPFMQRLQLRGEAWRSHTDQSLTA